MTEAKNCFLLVGVARPSVSLRTADGGKQRVEKEEKNRWQGQTRERRCEARRLIEIQQSSECQVKDRQEGKWVDRTPVFCFTVDIPLVQYGKCGESLFQELLLFIMPTSISGRNTVLQCCKYINMWGRKRRSRRSSVSPGMENDPFAPVHPSCLCPLSV